MKKILFALVVVTLNFVLAAGQDLSDGTRSFDNGWTFHLGGVQGAEEPGYNDASWRRVDLPHDWSIENVSGTVTPFYRYAIGQASEGFTVQGTGWYRKQFDLPISERGKCVIIQFDGVYMNSDVYVNGIHIGNHPYGYTSFYYDISKSVHFGQKNTIAVEVKNEGQNSRWYSGSGIYRHVWLRITDPVHSENWGTWVRTIEISPSSTKVRVDTRVSNASEGLAPVLLKTRLIDQRGKIVAYSAKETVIPAASYREEPDTLMVSNPHLWSCESPYLYRAVTEIYRNEVLISTDTNTFGVRKITVDPVNGFQLNGKTLKLKGGCFHLDNGPIGSRAYDRAEERKVELLKASGFNAIRCSHNPPSPYFLSACDRLGVLVIDEAFDMWNIGKTPYDYHLFFKDWWQRDIESMILRDRNHPAVIMWSIGNEIPERADTLGVQTAKMLASLVHKLDPTRAVTAAINGASPDKDPFFSALDVGGYNYAGGGDSRYDLYKTDHQRLPQRIMVGTESYPLEAFDAWMSVEDNPFVIGDFVWTAWDYIGEASIGWLGYPQTNDYYPWNLAFCGDIDICGWKRPQSFYRDALWKPDQLSLFVKPPVTSFKANPNKTDWSKWNWLDVVPEWNFSGFERQPLEVSVYSSCEKAELFINGRSLGVQNTNKSNKFIATWILPYQPGTLKAVGYREGKIVKSAELKTAAKPVVIHMKADRTQLKADNQDLSYVTVEITDADGNINPNANNLLHFHVSGGAQIIGVGNADPKSVESCQLPERQAWKGRCLVILKTSLRQGPILLTATSDGLRSDQIKLSAH